MLYGFQIAGTLPDLTMLPNFLWEEGHKAAGDGGVPPPTSPSALLYLSAKGLPRHMSTSSGSPSFLHDDTVSVFYEALSASLREVARIDRPETAPLLVHEGQRKLRGEKVTVPDSIVTMRHMGRNYHLYWMEVCLTQTLNNVFEKVRALCTPHSLI